MRRSSAIALAALVAVATIAAPAPAAASECAGAQQSVSGIAFAATCAGVAQLLLDPTIGDEDAAALQAQVASDVEAVQAEFDLAFDPRPRIHVLASTERYAAALHAIFGYPTATARWVADNSVSFFEPSLRSIAVNWEAVRVRRPVAAIRHELTHLITLRACAPRCDLVPAWLNEGQARFAEAFTDGSAWRELRMRYEAASLVATGTLLPLTALVTQSSWNAITGWDGYYKYEEAARAVELLRADIGASPMPRLYAQLRAGRNVAEAYAWLTGRSFADFVDTLPARMRGDDATAGIATTAGTPEGAGTSYVLYAFPPESAVTVSVNGTRSASSDLVRVSPQGAWFGWLDPSLPAGLYAITAAAGSTCASAVIVKRAGWRDTRDPEDNARPHGRCPRIITRAR